MNTVAALLDALGGSTAVARAIGIGPSTVSEWKRCGSVPVKHWPAMLRVAAEKGVVLDADDILRAHTGEGLSGHEEARAAAASAGKAPGGSP